MQKILIPLLIALTCHATFAASDAEKQAEDFTNLYTNTCIQHLTDLDKLREKLKDLPPVPKEAADIYLAQQEGGAWIVPHEPENYVIAIMKDKNYCAVFAHHIDAAEVEKRYLKTINQPPEGFTTVQREDEHKTVDGSKLHYLAHQWQLPDNSRKPTFMLTTTTDPDALMQAYISVAIAND